MSEEQESWLPNLVGGVSIWKLAPDLNEEQFFDGRLLVPETEGSDSLPVRVTWDLTALVPLPEARAKHPSEIGPAIEDFFSCLERTAQVFEKGGSGYDKYKQAFTVPAMDADGGAHYFYDPKRKKLCVINWGASPRKIKHAKEYLFGYQDFGLLIQKEEKARAGRPDPRAMSGITAGAAAEGAPAEGEAAAGAAADAKKEEEKKDGEKEEEQGGVWGKPWWMWLLYAVGLGFLIWLAIAILYDCGGLRTKLTGGHPDAGAALGDGSAGALDGGVAGADGSVLDGAAGASDAGGAIYSESTDDAGPRATELHDGGGRGVDGGLGAHVLDGHTGTRGGVRVRPPRHSRVVDGRTIYDGPPVRYDGNPYYGEYHDPTGGYYYWIQGPDGQPIALPHREHYHPEAVQWRIVGGAEKVYDYSGTGSIFHVYLRPGETFDGVQVQYRDSAGIWHDH